MRPHPPIGPQSPVIFDCDGLLISTRGAWDRAYAQLARQYGTTIAAADRRALARLQLEPLGRALAAILGHPAPARQLGREIHDLVRDGAGHPPHPMPGAVSLVQALHGTRPLAVASNTPRDIGLTLTSAGVFCISS